MGGLLNALNAGKTSLSTNQKSIEIAGNNIANVNTPGYSRQKPVLTPYPALNFGGFFIGQGVNVSSIEREYDVFIARQLQDKNKTLGEETAKEIPLAELERVFNVSEENLATEVDRFFDAWQELAVNPSGQVERDIVIQRGELLASAFHTTSEELAAVSRNVNNTLASKIEGVNFKLQQVADLNDTISAVESTGQTANTYRDQRDELLRELSYSLGIQSCEDQTGMVSVQLPGGIPLVEGNSALTLDGATVDGELQLQVHLGETTLDVDMNKLGGEFKGLLSIRDVFIPSLKDDLDKMAYHLVTAVNAQHKAGVGLDGIDGRPFFANPTSSAITVVLTNTNEIVAGSSSAPGDNTNAQEMAALGDSKVVDGEDTLVSFYGKIASRVGIEAGQNSLSLGGAEDALVQLNNMRDGKVGVSLEEEMIDLIQYQKGFEASAKYLSTVDEMMDTLLSLKR
jgi:flagellar hook-associated protein 1 FlgK